MTITQTEFEEIEKLIRDTVKEEISHLPTKDEFYKWMDKLMSELKSIREDHTVLIGQVTRHTQEIESLQKIHPNNKHFSTL